jgi:hypothetical protein
MEIRFSQTQAAEAATPPGEQPQPPMVYVYDDLRWEYKFIPRNVSHEWRLSGEELNGLGAEGWELAGIASVPSEVHFYFKRPRK